MEFSGQVAIIRDEDTGITYVLDMSEDGYGVLEQMNELPRGVASDFCRKNGMSLLALSFALHGLTEAFLEATGAMKVLNAIMERLPKDETR